MVWISSFKVHFKKFKGIHQINTKHFTPPRPSEIPILMTLLKEIQIASFETQCSNTNIYSN